MSDAKISYQRLPGSGMKRGEGFLVVAVARARCRLWQAEDHLLQVESQGGYLETYKRFYLRDIQAFIIRKTNAGMVGNILLAITAGLFLLWLVMINDPDGRIALGIIAGVFGVFLLINFLNGPTCVTHLKTAVHLEELPSLRRLRRARKVIARLQSSIGQAQGVMAREEMNVQFGELLKRAAAQAARAEARATAGFKPYASRAHQILFWVLLADALVTGLNIVLPSVPVVLLSMFTGCGFIGAAIIALVKQYETDLSLNVRRLTWVTGVYAGISYFIAYILMAVMIPTQRLDGSQWEYIKALAGLDPMRETWWLVLLIVTTSASALLGALGLLLLNQHWRNQPSVAPAAPAPENPTPS